MCVGFGVFPTVFGVPSPQFQTLETIKPFGAKELSVTEKDKPLQIVSGAINVPVTP